MILHIRILEEDLPDRETVEHYHRRVELTDAEAIGRIGRALDAELGKPTRKVRADKGSTRKEMT